MNEINLCVQGVVYVARGICHLFNRLLECCKGKPKAKTAIKAATTTSDYPLQIPANGPTINDRKVTRPVYLVPENHYVGNAHIQFQQKILQLAALQKLIYVMEGLERDSLAEKELKDCIQSHGIQGMSSGYLYGVEDPFFNLFNTALDLNNHLRRVYTDPELNEIIKNQKNDLLCPLVTKTNQQFLTNFWISTTLQSNPIFQFLNANKPRLIQQPFAVQSKIFAPEIAKWNKKDWFNFTKEISLILGENLKTTLPKEKLPTLESLLKSLKAFNLNSNYTQSSQELYAFMTQLHLTLRNDFIAANLKSLYPISETTGKPLVSILGDAHIKGITSILHQAGFTVLGQKELFERLKDN